MQINRTLSLIAAAVLAVLAGPAWSQEAGGTAATPPGPVAPASPGGAAPAGIALELNKLQQAESICQAYFLLQNGQAEYVKELQADVFLFDREGVILHGLVLPFADLAPGRTTVTAFELADTQCGDIGKVLLNRVIGCTKADGAPIEGCADRVSVTSRAGPPFTY